MPSKASAVFDSLGPLIATFLRAEDLVSANQCGDRGLLLACSDEALWCARCREDLAIRRPGKHNPGYYRGLYLEIVEERVELENSVAMGH